jgi:hypothetical protein
MAISKTIDEPSFRSLSGLRFIEGMAHAPSVIPSAKLQSSASTAHRIAQLHDGRLANISASA